MTSSVNEWVKVLIHPLGLTGYALFLLFGLMARAKRRNERRWILPVTLLGACMALAGGIGLAYRDTSRTAQDPVKSLSAASPSMAQQPQQDERIQQRSSGANSPNVQGTEGDVTFTYGTDSQPGEQGRQRRKTVQAEEKQAQ